MAYEYDNEIYFTVKDIAESFNISVQAVYHKIKNCYEDLSKYCLKIENKTCYSKEGVDIIFSSIHPSIHSKSETEKLADEVKRLSRKIDRLTKIIESQTNLKCV